eukprot:583725-Pleurochrysis_carterae.AAC.1
MMTLIERACLSPPACDRSKLCHGEGHADSRDAPQMAGARLGCSFPGACNALLSYTSSFTCLWPSAA